MDENNEDKPQKYSLVTGEKIKNKSVKRLKREHKAKDKKSQVESKKLEKQKKKVEKKLSNHAPSAQSVTLSKTNLESEGDKQRVDEFDTEQLVEGGDNNSEQQKVLIVRKTEKGNPVSLKRKVLNFISYALVGIIAVFFGYFAGNFYVANVLNKVDYSAFSESSLRDDGASVYSQIISSGRTPDRCSAVELFVAGEYLLGQQNAYRAEVRGEVQPSIGSTQSVWGYKSKNGSVFEVENVSKGMLSVAEYSIYNADSGLAEIYAASKITNTSAEYPTTPTSVMTYEEYRKEYGASPESPCVPYIVSSKTVVSGTESVTSRGDGTYQISFALATDSSVINYIKQVKHMSGLKDYPTFRSIIVTAIIDSDLRLSYIRYDESYTVVYFGVMATCVAWLENTITY